MDFSVLKCWIGTICTFLVSFLDMGIDIGFLIKAVPAGLTSLYTAMKIYETIKNRGRGRKDS